MSRPTGLGGIGRGLPRVPSTSRPELGSSTSSPQQHDSQRSGQGTHRENSARFGVGRGTLLPVTNSSNPRDVGGSSQGHSTSDGDLCDDLENLAVEREPPLPDIIKWESEHVYWPPTYVPPRLNAESLFNEETPVPGTEFDLPEDRELFRPKITGGRFGRPKIARTFKQAGLNAIILRNVARLNFEKPTPIQSAAIPAIHAGEDLMACAHTGSGKTAAYLLPIIYWIMTNKDDSRADVTEPYAIIVAPTRELAKQIFKEAMKLANGTGVKLVEVYGRTHVRDQIERLKQGCDIAIASIGRLNHMLLIGYIMPRRIKFVVLDEADRMLISEDSDETGQSRRNRVWRMLQNNTDDPERVNDFERLFEMMPPNAARQTLMFSATFPRVIQDFAQKFLNPNYMMIHIGKIGSPCPQVTQKILKVEVGQKITTLVGLLKDELARTERTGGGKYLEKTLVFVRTRVDAKAIAEYLRDQQIPASCLHGLRTQSQREDLLRRFAIGELWVLVATDVAARGLDIPKVDHVINYDLPHWSPLEDREQYVHRIGRTGRVGNRGRATSFFVVRPLGRRDDGDDDNAFAPALVQCLSDVQQYIPDWLLKVAGMKDNDFEWEDQPSEYYSY